LEQLPDLSVAPILAQDVSRVFVTINMVEPDDGSCNGFTTSVKRQSIVAFEELGVWNHRTIHHQLVVSKHVHFLVDWDTQILQGVPEINRLIHADASSNELRSIGGSFDCSPLLGVPVNGSLVGKV